MSVPWGLCMLPQAAGQELNQVLAQWHVHEAAQHEQVFDVR